MAEPEELIIDAARHATVFVSRLWHGSEQERGNTDTLADYRQRLELLLAAAYGYEIPVRVAQLPAPRSALSRLFGRPPRHVIEQYALPANDGVQIFLPLRLTSDNPLQLFRVLALQQAGRAARRTASIFPLADALVQDLFSISEAAAVDHALALNFPGLTRDNVILRRATLNERPLLAQLTLPERSVENLYRQLLDAHPARIPQPLIEAREPIESFSWAIATARRISTEASTPDSTAKQHYRGIRRGLWLGRTLPFVPRPEEQCSSDASRDALDAPTQPKRSAQLARRPELREKEKNEDDQDDGMWMLQMDDPQQHVEDPEGMQRPTDRDDDADAGSLADSLSELPEASIISTPRPAQEILLSDDPLNRRVTQVTASTGLGAGIAYPEWDYRIPGYVEKSAIVRLQVPPLGDDGWAKSVLAKRHALLLQVQRRFEGLRPRRVRQNRQADGQDFDISAYVNAFAERHAGLSLEDRLYQLVKPARRDIAIALLIDISGSTDGWVSHDLRIIDLEKEALLLVYQALSVLGDPFCIQAFSGEGPQHVTLWELKGFNESNTNIIQRRIAALEPQSYTRTGTAIRHATASLTACAAQYRLLILLSDGKPNDIDQYEGRYGVEDMRQAVAEATLQSVNPFCITVDRYAPQYLASIFSRGRYAVLQYPQLLPLVLVDVLKKLIKN